MSQPDPTGESPVTTASRSLATALSKARFASGLLRLSYTTPGDTTRADLFRDELEHFCDVLAALPGRGKANHGYGTPLLGVVFERNWIFFRLDETEARFVHIVAARRLKSAIRF